MYCGDYGRKLWVGQVMEKGVEIFLRKSLLLPFDEFRGDGKKNFCSCIARTNLPHDKRDSP
jgi:hypothetical protein